MEYAESLEVGMPPAEDNTGFEGFTLDDFDAYLPEKWNSNMFTLPRRKVKGKLEYLGERLVETLAESGFSLVPHLSDEFPSLWNKKQVDTQWLFFSRDEAARNELSDLIDKERTLADTLADPTPLYRQIFFGVAVKAEALELGIWLHHDAWVDRRNLSSRVAGEEGLAQFASVVASLPGHYELGLVDDEGVSPEATNGEYLKGLLTKFDEQQGWIFAGARMPRDQVPVLGLDIAASAVEVFEDMAELYRFVAWSPDNDAISLDSLVEERRQEIQASHDAFDREKKERERQLQEKDELGKKLREEIATKVQDDQAWRMREQAARRAAAARMAAATAENDARAKAEAMAASLGLGGAPAAKAEAPSAEEPPKKDDRPSRTASFQDRKDKKDFQRPQRPQRSQRGDRPRGKSREKQVQRVETVKVSAERAAAIEIGDGVEINRGFLRGRMGVVQEIDEKGRIRVNFGAVASWLSAEEVTGRGPATIVRN